MVIEELSWEEELFGVIRVLNWWQANDCFVLVVVRFFVFKKMLVWDDYVCWVDVEH